ncbi:MAG: TonB-dependent siderophore receptor, partial [Silanimonas sp.]
PVVAAAAPRTPQLKPVEVTGEAETAPSRTASKDGAPLRETPQAVSVIDAETLRRQRPASLNDVLREVPGVIAGTAGRRGFDDFVIRGFSQSAFAFRDGTRFDPGFLVEQEVFGLERIEVLKGPASVMYGQAGPGGIVNTISKAPTQAPLHLVEAAAGTDALARVAVDLGGPLGDREDMSFRLSALGQDRNDPIPNVGAQRAFASTALGWQAGASTTLTLRALHQFDQLDRVVALPASGTVLPNRNGRIDPEVFLGEPGRSGIDIRQSQVGYSLEHALGERWTLRQNARHTQYDVDGLNIIAGTLAADARTLARRGLVLDIANRVSTLDTQLHGELGGDNATHELLFGVDTLRFRNDQVQTNATMASIDVFAPTYGGAIQPTSIASDRKQVIRQSGLYGQWRGRFAERVVVLAGGRFDDARTDTFDDFSGRRTGQRDKALTGRLGAVLLLDGGFAPYTSLATSFVPVSGNPTRNGAALDPETGRQLELGLRWSHAETGTEASVAVFDIERQNVVSTDPTDPRFSVQVGEQRHRGAEIDLRTRFATAWSLSAGYAWSDAEITRSTLGNVGLRPPNVARHSANLWLGFDASRVSALPLELGFGARHVGERLGTASTTVLPAYTTVDAYARYRHGPWQFALNLKNLGDELWFAGGTGANFVSVGERRSALLTVGYSW